MKYKFRKDITMSPAFYSSKTKTVIEKKTIFKVSSLPTQTRFELTVNPNLSVKKSNTYGS